MWFLGGEFECVIYCGVFCCIYCYLLFFFEVLGLSRDGGMDVWMCFVLFFFWISEVFFVLLLVLEFYWIGILIF